MRPRIGISLTLDARLREGRRTWFVDAAYGAAVEAAGGAPAYVAAAERDAGEIVRALDGLVIPGGDDFLPTGPYAPEVSFRPAAAEQIAADLALVRAALAGGIPLLGVCYGMQLLALAAGGTLVYDIPHELPAAARHRLAPGERHALALAPDSRLAALFAARELAVNSRHHQGVADAGASLRVSARAGDGVIEAIESPRGTAFALGVQWHPEDLEPDHAGIVYGALVAAARARR